MINHIIGAVLAAGTTVAAPPALAREPRCITRLQFDSLTHVIFPIVVDATLTRCGSLLPSNA